MEERGGLALESMRISEQAQVLVEQVIVVVVYDTV